MKVFIALGLAALMILGVGCSSDKTTAPASSETLNTDVISNDAPANLEAAMQELAANSITVPDPVSADDPVLTQVMDVEAAYTIINAATLDDSGRVNFRRIVAHLHDQFQMVRRCMANNDDPRLLRLAHGAHQAYDRGLRALRANEPRVALRMFTECNRMLNLALRICRARG